MSSLMYLYISSLMYLYICICMYLCNCLHTNIVAVTIHY